MPSDFEVGSEAMAYIKSLCGSKPNSNYYTILQGYAGTTYYRTYGNSVNTFNRNFMHMGMSRPARALAYMMAVDNQQLTEHILAHVTNSQVITKLKTFKPNLPTKLPLPTVSVPKARTHRRFVTRRAPPPPNRFGGKIAKFEHHARKKGNYTVSGHGSLEYVEGKGWPTFKLPARLTINFYTPLYYALSDTTGGQIDAITLGRTPPRLVESARGGTVVWDFTLFAAKPHQEGGDIKLRNNLQDPNYFKLKPKDDPVRLSEIVTGIKKWQTGTVHWAACRVVHGQRHYVDPKSKKWVTDTFVY